MESGRSRPWRWEKGWEAGGRHEKLVSAHENNRLTHMKKTFGVLENPSDARENLMGARE
jgi:hypothetical protein